MIDESPLIVIDDLTIEEKPLNIPVVEIESVESSIQVPSINKIFRSRRFSISQSSLADTSLNFDEEVKGFFVSQFNSLLLKEKKFSGSPTYYNHLASLLLNAGRQAEAEKYLSKAAAFEGFSYLKGKHAVYKLKDNFSEENIALLKDISDSTNDTNSKLNMSLVYLQQGDIKSAVNTVNTILIDDVTEYNARLLKGFLNLLLGRPNNAIRDFRVALQEKPKSSIASANLSLAYTVMQNTEKAILFAERSYALNPTNRAIVIQLCDLYRIDHAYIKIVNLLEDYKLLENDDIEFFDRLARSYYELGKYNKAINVLKYEIKISETHATWNNLAIVYSSINDFDKAHFCFKKSLTLVARNYSEEDKITYNYMKFLVDSSNFSLAIQISEPIVQSIIQHKIKLNQYAYSILNNRIIALSKTESETQGAELAVKLFEIQDQPTIYNLNLSNYLIYYYCMYDKDKDKARKYVDFSLRVIDNVPNLPNKTLYRTKNNICYFYLEFGYVEQAKELFESIRSVVDNDIFLLATEGLLYFKLKSFQKAVDRYKQAYKNTIDHELANTIQQKMNLEIARYRYNEGKTRLGNLHYLKVIKIKNGSDFYIEEAKKEMSEQKRFI